MAARRVGDSYGGYRARLVEELRAKGIKDLAVLRAFSEVPRHLFVPDALRRQAYEDTSLPIGNRQTISQPFTHARYLEALALKGTERVLEVGTGTGFQTALLAYLAAHVISIERIPQLAAEAREALAEAGVGDRVSVLVGDGSLGWRPLAPFDAILIAAASPTIPTPLVEQLTEGGHLVMPLVVEGRQRLTRLTRAGNDVTSEDLGDANFVPLLGRHGFTPNP